MTFDLKFIKTLTFVVIFEPLEVEFHLGHNFLTVRDRDFIFGMYTQLIKPFQITPRSMTFCPWPLIRISKNFNFCHNFWTIRGRAFILFVYIPCDEAFLIMAKVLTQWPWPLTYISKKHNFCTVRDRDLIFCMYAQLMKPIKMTPRSMTLWPWPWAMTYISKTFKLCNYFWTVRDRKFIFCIIYSANVTLSTDTRLRVNDHATWPWPLY